MSKNQRLALIKTKPPVEKAIDLAMGKGATFLFCPQEDEASLREKAKHFGPSLRINDHGACVADARLVLFHRFDALSESVQFSLISARGSGVEVVSAMDYFDKRLAYTEIELLSPIYFMDEVGFSSLTGIIKRGMKRGSDLIAALALFSITWPVMLITAAVIRAESKGPIFFRQDRVGRFGAEFEVIKFRSMAVDAEKDGAKWATQNDPRVTKVGKFIRKTRIDELPQIFNVLKGQMSFVGPRPERKVFTDQLESQIPFYNFRHCMKPGITGYAQVKYPYGASVEDAKWKHRYDIYYIKHHSILFDIKIILLTVKVVLFGMGR